MLVGAMMLAVRWFHVRAARNLKLSEGLVRKISGALSSGRLARLHSGEDAGMPGGAKPYSGAAVVTSAPGKGRRQASEQLAC